LAEYTSVIQLASIKYYQIQA